MCGGSKKLLNYVPKIWYAATHQNTTVKYYASNMVLKLASDSSYLNELDTESNYGGYFFSGGISGTENPFISMDIYLQPSDFSNS